eukprot:TRINITY_DN9715_c0_g2_i1.p1 TRINITY_DN9715_c0_g2~~TRINITY_DN9715_c0_g2_i1.p1  ORF type:complete len:497 (+),score=66.96 TRINITY_DN9715_c0_g2_i1:115-1605(+)
MQTLKLLWILTIPAAIASSTVKITEAASTSFADLFNIQKEYVVNIVFTNDNALIFALVGNSDGVKNKLLTINLKGNLKPFAKELSRSIARLETVTLDNNYIISRNMEFIPIEEIVDSEKAVVEVKDLWRDSDIESLKIFCVKTLNKNSQFLLLTRAKELYLANNESVVPITSSNWIDNCGTIASFPQDSVIYGLSHSHDESIRRIDYFNTSSAVQIDYFSLNHSIEVIDFYQQLHVSPLGNYLVYLSPNTLYLYAVLPAVRSLSLIAQYNKPFTILDFINDNTILACEYVNGMSTLIEFDREGKLKVLTEYVPNLYFSVTVLKNLGGNKVILGDPRNLRILEIDYKHSSIAAEEWNSNVLIFGGIMAVVMILLSAYCFFKKDPPPPPIERPLQLATMVQESAHTENLVTDQDLIASGHRLMREVLTCSLSHEVMEMPVVISDGHSYEKAAIQEWLRNNNTSPVTREEVKQSEIVPNLVLEKLRQVYRSFSSLNAQP